MTKPMPFWPHSSTAWGTNLAGMEMLARSTSSGISSTDL
jgi:hypothetical protein